MHGTARSTEKGAGAVRLGSQHRSAAGGVAGDEFGGGNTQAPGHAGGFIRIELDFFEAAAGKAAMTGKAKG